MKKIFVLCSFLLSSQLMATTLICVNKHTTTISQSGEKPIVGRSSPDKGDMQLRLDLTDAEHNYLSVKNEKLELLYIGRSNDNMMYFIERTSNGNLNLYAVFPDGTLTISKSYNFLGLANMNVQTVYQCK